MVHELEDVVVVGGGGSWMDTWGSFYWWVPRPGDISSGGGSGGGGPPPTNPKAEAIAALQAAIVAQNGTLTEEQVNLMAAHDIKLSDILRPGIYQSEFNVAGVGEHRQWILVNEDGTSQVITARPTTDGKLSVTVETWETSNHGRSGDQGELRFMIVPSTVDDMAGNAALWATMSAKAEALNDRQLNYNVLVQNSNSAFNTVGLSVGFDDYDSGWAPGNTRNLDNVSSSNQPMPLGAQDFIVFSGGSTSDTRSGNSSPNQMNGGDGNDQFTGISGFDLLFGDDGNDILTLAGGSAIGGSGNDTLSGVGSHSVWFDGGDGADTLTGSNDADSLDGGIGDDIVVGGLGADEISGNAGNDELTGGADDDAIDAGDGDDVIYGDGGDDLILGGAGGDEIYGGDGADRIIAGSGEDLIYGGAGNDLLNAGDGDDFLWGGTGADTFVVARNESQFELDANMNIVRVGDRIMDFEDGVDRIDLSNYGITPGTMQYLLIFNDPNHINQSPIWGAPDAYVQYYNPNSSTPGWTFILIFGSSNVTTDDIIF